MMRKSAFRQFVENIEMAYVLNEELYAILVDQASVECSDNQWNGLVRLITAKRQDLLAVADRDLARIIGRRK